MAIGTEDLDLLLTAATPHGYGVAKDGRRAAIEVEPHAPKIRLGDQTESDREIAGDVHSLFVQARESRRPMVSKWRRDKRMLYNRSPWSRDRPDWLPSPLIPEILPIAAAIVGWMTDQRIGFTIAPTAIPHSAYHDFFQGVAADLEAAMDATWQVNSEESQWSQCIWDAVTYGTGFTKTTWDMTLAGGQGDAVTRRVSPWAIYPDPAATNLDNAAYVIEAQMMPLQELDRRYPGAAGLFPSGGQGSIEDIEPTQVEEAGGSPPSSVNPGPIPPSTSSNFGRSERASRLSEMPAVLVLEAWIRENHSYETTDAQSGEEETRTYDRWRVVVVAGDRVLMDEPADNLWAHGKHPYSRMVLWDQSEFWGRSMVEELTPCQLVINRILSALQQNVELTGNPVFRRSLESPSARQVMTSKPGTTIPVGAGDSVTGWIHPPPIHPAMLQLLEYYLHRMEAISGLSAITKGGTPGGRPAQSVVDALQEAAFVRIRQHLKELEYALRDAGYKRAALIAENYTQPRMLAIAGPSGSRTALTLKARHFHVPTSQGATPLMFTLGVDAGSRLHTSRAMREDREIQLYTLGLTDREAALGALKYANAGTVAKRMDEKEAMMGAMNPGARQRSS